MFLRTGRKKASDRQQNGETIRLLTFKMTRMEMKELGISHGLVLGIEYSTNIHVLAYIRAVGSLLDGS